MRTANLLTAASAPAAMGAAAAVQQHSAWHSPVPYLFGGLAAMLGLIAFALLILACSYWKLSGYLDGGSDGSGGSGDLESGDGKPRGAGAAEAPPRPLELGIVVIMAGEEKPTYLATPMSSRASSFGDNNKGKESEEEDEKKAAVETEGHGSSEATAGPQRQLQEEAHANQDQENHHSHDGQRQTPEEETHDSADRNHFFSFLCAFTPVLTSKPDLFPHGRFWRCFDSYPTVLRPKPQTSSHLTALGKAIHLKLSITDVKEGTPCDTDLNATDKGKSFAGACAGDGSRRRRCWVGGLTGTAGRTLGQQRTRVVRTSLTFPTLFPAEAATRGRH
ncbi:hypothetical protein Taro_041937 [Colocasia esculenta]|uniref:GDU1 n=1 Tax=Colocasia esculenta TaxID=4460 RepID=A0A843WFM1_COLES|nr:hypothetical protein [Colocasia esculenta]